MVILLILYKELLSLVFVFNFVLILFYNYFMFYVKCILKYYLKFELIEIKVKVFWG